MEESKGVGDDSMQVDSTVFLFGALKGHTDAVRCLDSLSDTLWNSGSELMEEYYVFSGSRDGSLMVWSEDISVSNSQPDTAYAMGSWVFSVAAYVKRSPEGQPPEQKPKAVGVAAGLQNGKIRLLEGEHPLRLATVAELEGHGGPVCSLHAPGQGLGEGAALLISGGWDDAARVWSLETRECLLLLGNQENNICVLGLSNGDVVTGSTGFQVEHAIQGHQIRLWKNGKVEKTNQDHSAGIRDLCAVVGEEGLMCASASNDGTVRLLGPDLACAEVFVCPDGSFAFSVAHLGAGRFAAAQESGTLVLFQRGVGVLRTINFTKGLWAVRRLPSDDFMVAGEDNIIIIFTDKEDKSLSQETLDQILGQNIKEQQERRGHQEQGSASSQQQGSSSPLPSEQDLDKYRGAKEGDISLFQSLTSNGSTAYRWEGGAWRALGPVAAAPVPRAELGGAYFDVVVPVEVDSASKGFICDMMGFNFTDDPQELSRNFCHKHSLPDEYLTQIESFIQQCQFMANM